MDATVRVYISMSAVKAWQLSMLASAIRFSSTHIMKHSPMNPQDRQPSLKPRAITLLVFLSALLADGLLQPLAARTLPNAPGLPGDEVVSMPLPGLKNAPRLDPSHGKRMLSFEPNAGRTDPAVKFLSRGPGYTLFVTPTETVISLHPPRKHRADTSEGADSRLDSAVEDDLPGFSASFGPDFLTSSEPAVLRMKFLGASAGPQVRGEQPLAGKVNYFLGNDRAQWRTNLPTFGRVRLEEVYPGIDLVYYGNEGQLEYDFIVAPGAAANAVTLAIEGAEKAELDERGDLVLWIGEQQLLWRKPNVFQQVDGKRQEIAGRYALSGSDASDSTFMISFELAAYDPTQALVIDPVLVYSTYLGGSGEDRPSGLAVDAEGNAVVVGSTESLDFPTKDPFQLRGGAWDAFITELSPTGELIFSTYLGGGRNDFANAIAIGSSGNFYIVGTTESTNFPVMNAFQPTTVPTTVAQQRDAFVVKLNSSGSALLYGTYLGGRRGEQGTALALDNEENMYIGGNTDSADFPTLNPIQPKLTRSIDGRTDRDAFVAKLHSSGSHLLYSTYFGGGADELVNGIAVDGQGSAYIAGTTDSPDLPVKNAMQPTFGGWIEDMFFAKLSPAGQLIYASYFGGSRGDWMTTVALNPRGELVIVGITGSADLPASNAFPSDPIGWAHVIIARLHASDGSFIDARYLGGSNNEYLVGMSLDASGDIYLTVNTGSPDFPMTDALQPRLPDTPGAFVTKLSSDGEAILFSTFLGAGGLGGVALVALDPSGNLILVHNTFIAKLSMGYSLNLKRVGQTLVLSWSASATGFVLEASDTVSPNALWKAVSTSALLVGDQNIVTVEIGDNTQFFRLRKM